MQEKYEGDFKSSSRKALSFKATFMGETGQKRILVAIHEVGVV